MERLQKVIANSGYTSRRNAEELIKAGRVLVNGEVVSLLGFKVGSKDIITIDGKTLNKDVEKVYYMLFKPAGYICSLKDELNRKVITDLIDCSLRIYPIGRLDCDTTGLIILTNDGDLTNKLSHPSFKVIKKYRVTIQGILTIDEIIRIKKGIKIDGIAVVPTRFKVKKKNIKKNTEILEFSIVEGRNHIVKRVFEAIGHPVIKLKRESYANLTLYGLKVGEYRPLTIKEVKQLKSIN